MATVCVYALCRSLGDGASAPFGEDNRKACESARMNQQELFLLANPGTRPFLRSLFARFDAVSMGSIQTEPPVASCAQDKA
jgi:hypothetical protein